jgi:hypothetical protein
MDHVILDRQAPDRVDEAFAGHAEMDGVRVVGAIDLEAFDGNALDAEAADRGTVL